MDPTTHILGRVSTQSTGKTLDIVARDAAGPDDGDAERVAAFRLLAERHLEGNYRLASVILGDGIEAQDAVHDAFVVAWRKWATLRDHGKFEPWFKRIVVNTCRDRLQRSSRWRVHDISAELSLQAEDDTETIDDRIVVRRALDRLRPDDRIVLALRYYRDLKVEEVAVVMGIRPRAATSRLHRALGRLGRLLEETDTNEAAR